MVQTAPKGGGGCPAPHGPQAGEISRSIGGNGPCRLPEHMPGAQVLITESPMVVVQHSLVSRALQLSFPYMTLNPGRKQDEALLFHR